MAQEWGGTMRSQPDTDDQPQPEAMRTSLGRNLTHGMLDTLGRAIVTGAYDGKRFPTESDLTIQHGVSRSVTREAVKMLTAKGLLSARPRQGTMVQPSSAWNLFDTDVLGWLLDRKFSLELLRQFNDLRLGIEPQAARLAARQADKALHAAIRAGFERMEAAEVGDDDPLEADIAFHGAIMDATANPFMAQFRGVVSTALRSSIRFTNRLLGHSADLAAHGAVLQAIEQGDGEAAFTAMHRIIDDVLTLIARSQGSDAS